VGLISIGLFMGLGVLMNAGTHGVLTLLFTLGVFSVLPIGLGLRLLRPPPDRPGLRADADQAWESELMRLAAQRDGALTVAEVVAHADLDAVRAERLLDGLCKRGLAEHRVTDEGQIVYRFETLPTSEQKRRAVGVLDD
jgi:hypothetical protein